MIMNTYKLATLVKDKISGIEGMLTHLNIYDANSLEYIFQPKKLNPSTGIPVSAIFLAPSRIEGGILYKLDVPIEIIGEKAEDTGTGYKGKVAQLVYHQDGCLHVGIKKPGTNTSGDTYPTIEFDIRRIKGPNIERLLSKEVKQSKDNKVSPTIKTVHKNR